MPATEGLKRTPGLSASTVASLMAPGVPSKAASKLLARHPMLAATRPARARPGVQPWTVTAPAALLASNLMEAGETVRPAGGLSATVTGLPASGLEVRRTDSVMLPPSRIGTEPEGSRPTSACTSSSEELATSSSTTTKEH